MKRMRGGGSLGPLSFGFVGLVAIFFLVVIAIAVFFTVGQYLNVSALTNVAVALTALFVFTVIVAVVLLVAGGGRGRGW
jgi:hypothetical protein